MKIKDKRIWLGWKYEEVNGKKTKVPYQANGKKASTTDPSTWTSYKVAKAKFKENIGFVFDGTIIGIDLDKVIDANGNIIDPASQALVDSWDSYIEYSPSGTGLHLLAFQTEQFEIKKKKHKVADTDKLVGVAYECYNSGRFFTFTDKPFDAFKQDMLEYDEAIFESHISKIGYPWGKEPGSGSLNHEESKLPVVITTEDVKEDEVILNRMMGTDTYPPMFDLKTPEYLDKVSETDMKLMCGFAFYTHNNAEQMRRLFANCSRGERAKVSVRKDYLLRLVRDAIAYTKEFYSWTEDPIYHATKVIPKEEIIEADEEDDEDSGELLMGRNGAAVNVVNTFRFINKNIADCFRFEEFSGKIQMRKGFKGMWKDIEDVDILLVQAMLQRMNKVFVTVKKEMVYDAIHLVANKNRVDVAYELFSSFKWDGVPRLKDLAVKGLCTEETSLNSIICYNWFVGAVNRIRVPGCKFDTVLVLEGKQGVGKSTAFSILGGEWYNETTVHADSKDMLLGFKGNWIIELAEGGSLRKAEQEIIKALLTTRVDKYRAPYGKTVESHPRRVAIAMTTNHGQYLKDTTGNRRFLPTSVQEGKMVDREWLTSNREQLIAEAWEVAKGGYKYWEFPSEELEAEQQKRMIAPPFQEKVLDHMIPWLQSEDSVMGILIETLIDDVVKLPTTQAYKFHSTSMEIAAILKDYLKMEKKRVMIGGVQKNRWFPTPATKAVVDGLMEQTEVEQEF